MLLLVHFCHMIFYSIVTEPLPKLACFHGAENNAVQLSRLEGEMLVLIFFICHLLLRFDHCIELVNVGTIKVENFTISCSDDGGACSTLLGWPCDPALLPLKPGDRLPLCVFFCSHNL